MADKKISALTAASTPLAGTEVLPIVQSGSTVKVSVENLTLGRAVNSAGGTITDNIVQGTAGKGFNFTANTPAAGMTSELLNWYEEGTFTPTFLGTVVGTLTATGTYTRIGRMVSFTINLVSTTSTTAVQDVAVIQGFPFVMASSHYPTFGIINRSNSATVGIGNLAISGGQTTAYTPGWTALANVAISGFYYV